jgi:hypothetical protein
MNDLKKGALTVVVATIITSLMILMTDISIAKSPLDNSLSREQQATGVNINSISRKAPEVFNGSVSSEKVVNRPVADTQLPPPGPFLQGPLSGSKLSTQLKVMEAPSAPKAPVGLVIKKNTAPAKPDRMINAPAAKKPPAMSSVSLSQPQKAVEPKINASQPNIPQAPVSTGTMLNYSKQVPAMPASPQLNLSAPVKSVEAPVLDVKTMKPPAVPRNSSQQPTSINYDKPIWMQQNTRVIQDPNMQQAQQLMQQQGAVANRMHRNNTTNKGGGQQYRYVPIPVYPSYYQQQQMPMNNSGYYNAPIPNYWALPIMPEQAQTIEKLLEPSPSSLPTNKGAK